MFVSFPKRILHPLFSRNALLFSMNIAKVMLHFYISFKVLFQESTASIHGLFCETKPFSKYYCIYWGILCQGNAAFSWRNVPPCLRNVSLFSMEHCKKSNATLHFFWIYYCFRSMPHRLGKFSYWRNSVLFQTDIPRLLPRSKNYCVLERVLQSTTAASLKSCYIFSHFSSWNIAKSDAELLLVFKNTTHIRSVPCPFKDFLWRQNLFKVLLHLSIWKK